MSDDLKNQLSVSFKKISGLDLKVEDAAFLPVWSAGNFAIEIQIMGAFNGWLCAIVAKDTARRIATHVLGKAMDREYRAEEIDDELAENTVGELVNISLGEFIMAQRNERPTNMSSPIYHDTASATAEPRVAKGYACIFKEGEFQVQYHLES